MKRTFGSDPKIIPSVRSAIFIVLLPLLVFVAERVTGRSFSTYGLLPRDITGLRGIVFMPFLHADWSHLLSNMSALWILCALGFYTFGRLFWGVLGFVWIASGTWTWFFARPDYHIGASGVVYGVAVFCLLSGFLNKNRSLQGLTLLTLFLYGSFLWGVFPWEFTRDISWEGHLAGALAGLIMALVFRRQMAEPPVYSWDVEPEPEVVPEEDMYWIEPRPRPETEMEPEPGPEPEKPSESEDLPS